MPARNPRSIVVEEAIETYFNKYGTSLPSPPLTLANRKQIASELMLHIAVPFEAANALLPAGSRYSVPRELPSNAVAELMLRFDDIKFVDFGQGSKDNNVPAVYMHEGPDEGIYSTLETEIGKRIRVYRPDANEKFIKEVLSILRTKAEHVKRYQDTNLIPVNNGLFDRKTKTLQPFTPDLVYVTKCRVDYKDNPSNPVFTAPDGSTWDVETWMSELSDNPEIVELLWQVLGAAVRSGEPWDKIILL